MEFSNKPCQKNGGGGYEMSTGERRMCVCVVFVRKIKITKWRGPKVDQLRK